MQIVNLPESEHPLRVVVQGQYELRLILPQAGEKAEAMHFHADGQIHQGSDD